MIHSSWTGQVVLGGALVVAALAASSGEARARGGVIRYVGVERAPVRRGPGEEHAKEGVALERQTPVLVLGWCEGWRRVRYRAARGPDRTGWVRARTLVKSRPRRHEVRYATRRTTARRGPSKEFAPLRALRRGQRVAVLARRSGWRRVRYGEGLTGWVPHRLLGERRPLRTLAQQARAWAPDFYQDTDDSCAVADLVTAIDYDGDAVATNNWESLERFSFETLLERGVVYWWGCRTATHDFLGYALFHPRDWDDHGGVVDKIRDLGLHTIKGSTGEHENDMEGVLLVVPRGAHGRGAEPVLMITQAHAQFFQYGPASLWRERGRDDLDGPILRDPRTGRVQVFVQAKGHGIYGSTRPDFHPRSGDGVLYTRGGSTLPGGRDKKAYVTGYRLESLTPWWDRFHAIPSGGMDETFTRAGKVAFRGDTRDPDGADPPWNWKDKDYRDASRLFFPEPARFATWLFAPTARFSLTIEKRTCEQP